MGSRMLSSVMCRSALCTSITTGYEKENNPLNNLILGRSITKKCFLKKMQFKTSSMATHMMEKTSAFLFVFGSFGNLVYYNKQ